MKRNNHPSPALWVWVTLIALATLAVLGGGYTYYRYETERIRQEKYGEIAAIAELKAGQIRQWREERMKDLWRSSGGQFFKKGLQEFLRDRNNKALQEELQGRIVMEREVKGYADVLVLDLDGNILLFGQPRSQVLSPFERRIIDQALTNRSAVLSDLYRVPDGSVRFDGVVPFLDGEGRPIAMLIMRSNADSLLYPLIQSWPLPSRTAETLLVRREGEDVLFLNDLRHRPNSALSLREPLTGLDLPAVQAALGRSGMFQGKDYRGVEVLADLRPIPDSPWFMVTKVDTSEILGEARYRGTVIAVFSALFILLASALTAYGYRYRQARLYQDLYRSEREQREAQEQFRTILYSIGDAVITTDTGGVVKQMNPTAETLTGWPAHEAVGRPLEEVFRIINSKTRQSCENPVQKVLKLGQVVGLANDTLLIGRDGTEHVLADSGAPIRAEEGDIAGVVLVFRDVTARASAAEELRTREEMLRAILAASPVGIVLTQGRRIKWANDAWVKMFGFGTEEECLGQPTSIMHPAQDDYERARERLYEDLKHGQVSETDALLKRKDGTTFEGNIRINLVDASDPSKGTISAIVDISEKKKAEQALRTSESFLNSVIDQSPYPMFISDHQGTLIRTNKALSDLLHVSDEELIGKYNVLRDNIVEEQGFLPLIKSVFERGDTVRFEIKYDSSQLKHIQVRQSAFAILDITIFPIKDSNGKIANAVIQHIDITDRKQAEELLRESEERFRLAWETSPGALGMTRLEDGTYVDVNRGFTVLSGYNREEVLGKSSSDVPIWHDPASRQRYVSYLRTNGHVENFESKMRRKDGQLRTVLMSGALMTLNGEPHIMSIGNDVEELYQAAQALRASEEKYRRIFESSIEGIFQTTSDGRLISANPALARMFGYGSPEEMISDVTDLAHQLYANSDDREEFKRRLSGPDPVVGFEVEGRRKDGTNIWVSLNAHAVRDESGIVVCYEGTAQDTTERKRAEEALQESEEQFRLLFENSLDAILLAIPDGKVLRANPAACQMFDMTEEEICRAGREGLVDMTDPGLKPALNERKSTGKFLGELKFKRKDGKVFPTEISSVLFRDAKGEWKSTMIIRDLTQRKRSEEAQKRLATAVEQAAEAILVTDNQGTIQYVNPAFQRVTGYNAAEVIGQTPRVLKSGQHDVSFYKQLWNTIKGGNVWSGRLINKRKNGGLYHEDATISPVKDHSGNIVNFVAVKRDVTEHLELSKQLQQAQKMEAIGTLAGGIAHDFNNLLTVVHGFSEMLLAEKDEKDPDHADLQKILHAARNGAVLVQRLLMFSRKSEPKPVHMNLNKQIVQIEKLLRRTIPRMIDIRLELAADLPEIKADPSQIEQVLMNLAVNSRDAMPAAGKLIVKTDIVTLDEDYCRSHIEANPGEYVSLEVSDTGHGMDRETLEHIFEPFFTTKEIGQGTGLGLAMVYGIVIQHNGHITVSSEVGKGTTFRVYLPAIPAEAEPEVADSGIILAFGTETVLLVDDEEFLRELGARILTKQGYTVLRAKNGTEALDLFKKKRSEISLVILDLIMPEMGGTQCLKELLDIDPQVKVLVASGYAADRSVKETLQMGAKGFVRKPFIVRELLRDIRKVLDEG